MNTISKEDALKRAAAYCAKGEHCTYDVAEKLRGWRINDSECEEILARLNKEGFINDARYCRSFVNDKFRFAKWGRIKIAYALRAKRMPQPIIQEAMDEIDEDDYLQILNQVVQAKSKSIRANSEREFNHKLMRFVASRGFETELLRKIRQIDEDCIGSY